MASRQLSMGLLVALALICGASCVAANAQLCNADASPATARNLRVVSQKFLQDKNKVEVVVAFDNPTTSNTGCPNSYTIGLVDSKNVALGGKYGLSNPITSPISATYFLAPGSKYTIKYVEMGTAKNKVTRATFDLKITTLQPAVVLPTPTPTPVCSNSAQPVAASNIRVESQKVLSSGKVETVIAWNNPTTSSTGCISKYTLSYTDSKGTALGGKYNMASPTTSPVKTTYYLSQGSKYTIGYVETETAAGKKTRAASNLVFTTIKMTVTPL